MERDSSLINLGLVSPIGKAFNIMLMILENVLNYLKRSFPSVETSPALFIIHKPAPLGPSGPRVRGFMYYVDEKVTFVDEKVTFRIPADSDPMPIFNVSRSRSKLASRSFTSSNIITCIGIPSDYPPARYPPARYPLQ